MAEEQKQESCACMPKGMAAASKVLAGVVLIALGVLLCARWWLAIRLLIQGCLGPFLILVGLVFIAIAKE